MTIDEKADVLRVLMKDVDPDEDIETVVLEYYPIHGHLVAIVCAPAKCKLRLIASTNN